MAVEPASLTIEIPAEATAQQEGPFFGVHSGVITGIYNSDGWPFVHSILKSTEARKFIDPIFGRFPHWNAAVWFRKTGIKLNDNIASQLDELQHPPRQILSAEVFSALYPPGTTIIHHDNDEIIPYTGRETRVSQVFLMAYAFEDCLNPTPNITPVEPLKSGTTNALALSSEPSTRGAMGAIRHIRHASPPQPTIHTNSRPPSPPPPTWVSRSGNEAWARSIHAASPTITMSSPERSPERPSTTNNLPSGSRYHPSSQVSTTSTQQLPGSQEAGSQLQFVVREARHRMRSLRNMRHQDSTIESQICTKVILLLLVSGDFTTEGLTEIMNAAADLAPLGDKLE